MPITYSEINLEHVRIQNENENLKNNLLALNEKLTVLNSMKADVVRSHELVAAHEDARK